MQNPPNAIAIPKGTCYICGESLSRDQMSDHLESCREKHPPQPSGKREYHRENVFHITVEGTRSPQYWMHLEAPASMTLADLDASLRRVWLECCGHLSQFIIEGNEYVVDDFWEEGEVDGPVPIETEGESMDTPLAEVLRPGMTFTHEYDMGSTTELTIRVVSQRPLDIPGRFTRIVARNDPPDLKCDSCGKPATQICAQCFFDGKGWLCEGCAPKHICGEELLLPVLNSPRAGTCAYGRDFDEDDYFEEEAEE